LSRKNSFLFGPKKFLNAAKNKYLIGSIFAIARVAIAKECLVDALKVTALQLTHGTHGLISFKDGPGHAWLRQSIAVLHLKKKYP